MLHVDDTPETLHIYVVRDEVRRPQLYPIFLSVLALASLVALSGLSSYQQPVTRAVIRVRAVLLPIKTFSASVAVIPTGIRIYPATTAHGVLTITNGSVISQTLPAGFTTVSNNNISVITDRAVFIPVGNAYGYGYAVNQVEGSSVYIRNLAVFYGGRDSYSVKFITAQDRQTALVKARNQLEVIAAGLRYPCLEDHLRDFTKMVLTWRCQFLTYHLPSYMHVSNVQLIGTNFLLSVWYIEHPKHFWVK